MLTVNDKTYDSGKGEIRFATTAAAINKIATSDKLNVELARRIGSQEAEAMTDGEYEPEDIAVTLEMKVWQDILTKLPQNGYGNIRFPVVAHMVDEDLGEMKIECLNCRIIGVKDNIEAGPGVTMCELTLKTLQVLRNGKSLNRRKGMAPTQPATL